MENKIQKCSIEGCCKKGKITKIGTESFIKGYCTMHYQRFKKYGDANFVINIYGEKRKDIQLYNTWNNMRHRCYNEKHKQYKDYGGRGIKICEEWKNNLMVFCDDVGERPFGCTLDRIDINGNYCKSNCRWATKHEQGANKRSNTGYLGVHKNLNSSTWRAMLTVNRVVYYKDFKTEKEAIDYRKHLENTYL